MARKKFGRPSKYKAKFCQQLIDFMEKGYSFEAFGAEIDVNQDTLHQWAKRWPEFTEAKKLAYDKSRRFWEKVGIEGLHTRVYREGNKTVTKTLNVRVWELNLKSKFKEWRNLEKDPGDADKVVEPPKLIINVKHS